MRTLSATVLFVIALTALPATADTMTTTVEDECGDAYSSVTVDGERVAVEDPLTPRGDIEAVTVLAAPASLAITLDMCADIASVPENRHSYNTTWDAAPLSAAFVSCEARLALRNRNQVRGSSLDVATMEGTFEVTCDRPAGGDPVATFERVSVVDLVVAEGEGYVVDGDTLSWRLDASTVGDDAMEFLAPGTVLADVEAHASSGAFSAIYANVQPVSAQYGAFGDRVAVGDVHMPN